MQFQSLGFLVLRNHLAPSELEELRAEMGTAMSSAYAHSPFDGSRRHWLPMMGPETPTFAALLEDPRFLDTTEQLLGAPALGWMVDANRYVGDTAWHNDAFASNRGVKWAIYLEPTSAERGALRVVPCSQNPVVNAHVGEFIEMAGHDDLSAIPAMVLDSQPGDVVAFDFRCWHASVGGGKDRSMFTVEYFELPPDPQAGLDLRSKIDVLDAACEKSWGDRVGHPFYEPRYAREPLTERRQLLVDRLRGCGFNELAGSSP